MGASLERSHRTRYQEACFPLRGAACVIEPDDGDRDAISTLLRHMGFATHDTGLGSVGSMIADQIKLSVIVVNVMVQDVQGLKLIRRLRTNTPSVVLVALAPHPCAMALANLAGADAVLASPLRGEAFCATVTEALRLAAHDESASVRLASLGKAEDHFFAGMHGK